MLLCARKHEALASVGEVLLMRLYQRTCIGLDGLAPAAHVCLSAKGNTTHVHDDR